ncbi:MAG: hypothetical protein RIQ64_1069, partial [Actinomycetota bacterium]
MSQRASKWRQIALGTAVFVATIGGSALPFAQAVGPSVWWVAASGTAASPATNGSSCANPSYVGSTDEAIQSAINAATAGDEIRICEGTYSIGTTIEVNRDLTFTGQGGTLPVLDGGGQHRIMSIASGGLTVTVDGLQFRDGRVTGGTDPGAAVNVHPSADFTVNDSYFTNNIAEHHGGAIAMLGDTQSPGNGTLTVSRTSFYKNRAYDGGAIVIAGVSGQSTVANSTFFANRAERAGGAISASFGDLTATRSTFIDNTNGDAGFASATWVVTMIGNIVANSASAPSVGSACYFDNGPAPINNMSNNSSCLAGGESTVSYTDLKIGFFAYWGSKVPTMSIEAASPAIDAVAQAGQCTGTDQRGQARSSSPCDAGAFEYNAGAPSISASSDVTLVRGVAPSSVPTFSQTGLTAPVTYRVADELGDALPAGTVMSTGGVISGTPSRTPSASYLVVSGRDANGVVTSTKLVLDNCLLALTNGTYPIASLADLDLFQAMSCGRDADYIQTADINWNGAWNNATTTSLPFTGTFDGDGHSITGLQISGDDAGFIPFTQGATISNVSLGVVVNGSYGSGAVARLAKSTTITNVRVSGTVAIAAGNTSQGCLGGLVGETSEGTNIQKSSFTGTVAGPSSSWNGGLIGCAYEQSIVGKSYVDGSVSGADEIGGLIGWMDQSDITDSYMVGSVTATGSKLGGLVGWLGADGSDAGDVAIRNSYASAQIQGVTNVGALVGEAHSTALESSHWEAGLTGVTGLDPIGLLSDQGGTQPPLAEVTPAAMKTHSFFDTAGWSIESGWSNPSTSPKTWGICETQTRPFLLWQHASSPCSPPSSPTPPSNDTTPPSSTPDTTTPSDSTTSTTTPSSSATEKSSASTTTTSTTTAPTTETSTTT